MVARLQMGNYYNWRAFTAFGSFSRNFGNFTNAYDSMRFPDWLMPGVVADRKNMRTDAFHAFLLSQ